MEFSLINLLLVLLVAWVTGAFAKRIGYPSVLGELLAGIIFGPALLGIVHGSPGLDVLAEIGVFLMMLYIGMEVDYHSLLRSSKGGLLAAMGGFIVPYGLGYYLTIYFGYSHEAALFLGLAMGVTSLATKSRIIVDLDLIGTRISNVLFAGALLCDTAALIVFALIMGTIGDDGLVLGKVSLVAFKALLFFGITIVIGLKAFPYIGSLLNKFGFTERTTSFTLVILIGLLFAELAELSGLHSILGAFFAGLFLKEGVLKRKLSHDVSQLVRDSSFGFLAPIFFVNAGFHVNLGIFQTNLSFLLLVFVIATLGKIIGTVLFYLPSRNGWREGLAIGAGMNGRGAVEIIIAEIALEKGIISQDIFSALVIMAFGTTVTVPILLKSTTEWLRKRDELVREEESRSGAIIFGATPFSCLLGKEIEKFEPVTLIDNSEAHCNYARKCGLNVIQKNVLNTETLEILRAASKRFFFALSANAAVNFVAAKDAKNYFSIPEIYTTTLSKDDKESDDLFIPKKLFPPYVNIHQWSAFIHNKQVQTLDLKVHEQKSLYNFLQKEGIKDPYMVLLLIRKQKIYHVGLLETDFMLLPEDILKVLQPTKEEFQLMHNFKELLSNVPILDFDKPIDSKDYFQVASSIIAEIVKMDSDELLNHFIQEEKMGNPSFAPGVAIPHILVEKNVPFSVVVARCKEGISNWSIEGEPKIIFTIVTSSFNRNIHLHFLSNIAQILNGQEFEKEWLTAKSKDDLREVLLRRVSLPE